MMMVTTKTMMTIAMHDVDGGDDDVTLISMTAPMINTSDVVRVVTTHAARSSQSTRACFPQNDLIELKRECGAAQAEVLALQKSPFSNTSRPLKTNLDSM